MLETRSKEDILAPTLAELRGYIWKDRCKATCVVDVIEKINSADVRLAVFLSLLTDNGNQISGDSPYEGVPVKSS